ncbi:Protein lunapark [Microtus ochrogaster]|uniref:Endoplasmic reticulum junction formation protein lunapark n=1 Tax=Microtus ochrogaster TaxID=79684 RepID=A0A8J6KPI7_MICOH|nr:Protein lunapark [Microtus ochrogaster]
MVKDSADTRTRALPVQIRSDLEEVMEKETYKTAKLILERFDPESKKAKRFVSELQLRETFPQHQRALIRALLHKFQSLLGLQRMHRLQGDLRKGLLLQPYPGALDPLLLQCLEWSPSAVLSTLGTTVFTSYLCLETDCLHPPGPPLARPILPRERGALDRIVEYLVGDGPQNRYALICQQCFSHNGMALKEEFEYIAFRCAYCFFLNPARKTRPQAPRLPEFSFEKRQAVESSSSAGPITFDIWLFLKSYVFLFSESLEEQDVFDNSTEQRDENLPVAEQTRPVSEDTSGSEEAEEQQEETETEETPADEAKSDVLSDDSVSNLEPSGESLVT